MPQQISLIAPILVLPVTEQGENGEPVELKEIVIPDGTQVYRYKMSAELALKIATELSMSNEDLMRLRQREQIASSLQMPPGVDVSKILENGKGQG